MGDAIRWVLIVTIRVGFWASAIFVFLPILTLLISGIIIALDGSVLEDIFYMVQMWLPFNLNVLLLWLLTMATAFIFWYVAKTIYQFLNALIKV